MSGNTGKMTADAIRERGPRFVLGRVFGKLTIYRENETFRDGYGVRHIPCVIAKSYTLSYLRRIARGLDVQG